MTIPTPSPDQALLILGASFLYGFAGFLLVKRNYDKNTYYGVATSVFIPALLGMSSTLSHTAALGLVVIGYSLVGVALGLLGWVAFIILFGNTVAAYQKHVKNETS